MLDEIYTDQFDKIASGILHERANGHSKLKIQVLKDERLKEPAKSILKHLQSACELMEKNKDYFQENGLRLENSLYKNDLSMNSYDGKHPKLYAYEQKTHEIEVELAKKRKEIRARVYGLNTTYEEVEKEVSAYIARLK